MKKGQLQTLEPVLIVIVLGLILGIGLLFYVRVSGTQENIESSLVNEKEAIVLLKKVTTLPELSCPVSETVETFCIDVYKARVFSEMMQHAGNRTYYFPLLGSSSIELQWVSLDSGLLTTLMLYDALPPDVDVGGSTTYFTVYNPLDRERAFALVTIRREIS